MAGNCVHLAEECCLDVCITFLGLGCSCQDLGWLSLTCENGLLGVLVIMAGLCYGGLLTSIGILIRLSQLRDTIIQADNAGAIL